jgi:signal transduction histidine kinase
MMIPPATSVQEIYQHYHRGPLAVLKLFERVFESVSLYGSPSEDQHERSLKLMSEEVDRLKKQIENQQVEISRLRHRNYELERRNSELESTSSKIHLTPAVRPRPIRVGKAH